MKLKILLLPLTLLVAFSLIMGFIYPEFSEVVRIYNENKELNEKLEVVANKSANVRKLDEELGANKSEEEYILKYVPRKRAEERAIDAINSIADSKVLVISDISIKNDPNIKIIEEIKKPSDIIRGSAEATEATGQVNNTEEDASSINKTLIIVGLVGKYDDIKSFILSMNNIDMSNDIVSVKISRPEEDADKTTNDDETQDQTVEQATSSSQDIVLSAEIEINFHNLISFKSNNYFNEEIFENSTLDFSKLNLVREFVKNEMKELQVTEGNKINPFL